MKVGIIQSNYLPWKGYFDFIDDVDLFIFHDDLQYTKGDWRNRNQIKTEAGSKWLTVPVKYKSTSQLILETQIDYSQKWQEKHLNQIKANYSKAPFYEQIFNELRNNILQNYSSISELNITLIKWLMGKLSINTPLLISSELSPKGSKTERLIDILTKVGAKEYLSGPSAVNYLKEESFEEAGIALEYKSYSYSAYKQLSSPFEEYVTVLDLIFNEGFDVRKYFKSTKSNQKVIFGKKKEIAN